MFGHGDDGTAFHLRATLSWRFRGNRRSNACRLARMRSSTGINSTSAKPLCTSEPGMAPSVATNELFDFAVVTFVIRFAAVVFLSTLAPSGPRGGFALLGAQKGVPNELVGKQIRESRARLFASLWPCSRVAG
jgi:hypothetical protein